MSIYPDTRNIHFQFVPCAYFQLKINEVNCEDPYDEITVTMHPEYGINFPPIKIGALESCYSEVYDKIEISSGTWIVEWWIKSGEGLPEYNSDTLFFEENEYKFYEIDY